MGYSSTNGANAGMGVSLSSSRTQPLEERILGRRTGFLGLAAHELRDPRLDPGHDRRLEPGRLEEPQEEVRVELPQLRGPARIPELDALHDRTEHGIDHDALQLLHLGLLEPDTSDRGHL